MIATYIYLILQISDDFMDNKSILAESLSDKDWKLMCDVFEFLSVGDCSWSLGRDHIQALRQCIHYPLLRVEGYTESTVHCGSRWHGSVFGTCLQVPPYLGPVNLSIFTPPGRFLPANSDCQTLASTD